MWGDTPETRQDNEVNGWRYLDIFDLRLLFEMELLYDEICDISIARYEEKNTRRGNNTAIAKKTGRG